QGRQPETREGVDRVLLPKHSQASAERLEEARWRWRGRLAHVAVPPELSGARADGITEIWPLGGGWIGRRASLGHGALRSESLGRRLPRTIALPEAEVKRADGGGARAVCPPAGASPGHFFFRRTSSSGADHG